MCDIVAPLLLDWYDTHARSLPWRVPPADSRAGKRAPAYHVWLSEIMLQQTTVATVGPYFQKFLCNWPDVHQLAAADEADVMAAWAGLGYYARARNLLACARHVSGQLNGNFPTTAARLRDLPGIGPYTASAIAAIALGHPEVVVDGNVERVMARLHDVHTALPGAKPELTALAATHTPQDRAGDYAQAVMDLGATICTPRNPACGLCPLRRMCLASARGTAETLPRKAPKKPKPIRLGHVYVARNHDGDWLLERRPPKGLLGGMLGWPTTQWQEGPPTFAPPFQGEWQDTGLEARHTFTHFHLRLAIYCAPLPDDSQICGGVVVKASDFRQGDLPTAMRKAYDLAVSWKGWTS